MQYRPAGHGAKSNDAATWCDFHTAFAAHGFDGISFALGDGWAGIDFDHCVHGADYAYNDVARTFFKQVPCYCDISPSRTGFKAIGRSAHVGGQIDFAVEPPAFTRWHSPRFFTVTGHTGYKTDPTVDITSLITLWFPEGAHVQHSHEGYRDAAMLSDDDLFLQMIGTDAVGDRILALWRGDTSAYGDDHSRADQALCCHLAFWTNYDAERIDRMFRRSGLMRPKWEANSYREATLGKACNGRDGRR
jgi:primase-polymerase (primpol)-like protein